MPSGDTNQTLESEALQLKLSRRLSLTARILAVNTLTIFLTAVSFFYLDNYRADLVRERLNHAQTEAELIASAVAGRPAQDQAALLTRIAQEQSARVQIYGGNGKRLFDSFAVTGPTYRLVDPATQPWRRHVARAMDRGVDWIVNAKPIARFVEQPGAAFGGWTEAKIAHGARQAFSEIRYAPDRTPMISAAIALPASQGAGGGQVLHISKNARDITRIVRDQRAILGILILASLLLTILLSLFLGRTIVTPLRSLARAALQVRLGRAREVEVPRLPDRRDEIGLLARSLSDMTAALRQRIDATESFAADVAHEIKNPLASIRSALDTMARVDDPEVRKKLTDIAQHDVIRIDRLINEISEASRVEAQLSRTRFRPIDLGEMIEALLDDREQRQLNSNRRIAFARPRRRVAEVMGEPTQLERVLTNLLDNAVSFSPEHGVIAISATCVDNRVIVTVSDEGQGVPDEEREAIFKRFHSARPTDEDFGGHSGLGLAIARTIVESHDGSIRVSNREDGASGACFTIDLPAGSSYVRS